MLQIATGRLFSREAGHENRLRGTIFTNAAFPFMTEAVEVMEGRLLPPSTMHSGVKAVAYEFIERIELEPDGRPSVLMSSTEVPYTVDFASVCSLALDCICSPDYGLVQRLTGVQPSASTRLLPGKFIKRTFDADLILVDADLEFLRCFVHQLVSLPRKQFLGAMRAVRTYVTAIHRVADDLELAYTLLVASVESLAQEFDNHQAEWSSVEDRKRNAINAALCGAPEDVSERVRSAILSIEHVALARRFREFVAAYTKPSFFREDAIGIPRPTARTDLEECLRQAYTLRSKYVHSLRQLPHLLTTGHTHIEVAFDGQERYFTLAGLARLMRHVIVNFVMMQQTVPREAYDYSLERHGVGVYRLAPELWIGNAEGDITGVGKDKLAGFLEQLVDAMLQVPGATVTDLGAVLTAANQFIPGLAKELRRPYLALMLLFNWSVPETSRVQPVHAVVNLIEQELGEPSTEAMLAHCLTDQIPDWPLATHAETLDSYYRRRTRKGICVPRLLEAAMTLDLAERFRASGDEAGFRKLVARSVEANPGNTRLIEFEAKVHMSQQVRWRTVLLPESSEQESHASAEES